MMRKTSILLAVVLAIAFMGFSLVAFGLPKDKQAVPAQAGTTQAARPAPLNPVVVDDDQQKENFGLVQYPVYPRGAASRYIQAGVPYVTVRTGIPETPGGNNHMRDQVQVSPSGVAHMVYGIISGFSTAADTAINFLYFYNAYDCSNSDALRNGSLDVQLTAPGPPADPRPRVTNRGGVMIPNPSTGVPVTYGIRFILRTETPPAGDVSSVGQVNFRDGSECLGLFSMDTTMRLTGPSNGGPTREHPVAFALNESVWVATSRAGNSPSAIAFNYTTDRGLSWSSDQILATYSPWFNSVEITGAGNTFYILSHADPNDPSAFTTTERPCYLKGTYNPGTGAITFGTITDITGDFRLPGFLANMIDIDGVMIGDTLHVMWTDWNNFLGNGFAGPGGAVWHAAVLPDGTVQGPHKITDILIDGRLPDRSGSLFGFDVCNWPMVELAYQAGGNLYALWAAPPDDGNFGWGDYEQYGVLAVYDIFCSVSPNNGRAWDEPQNVTQTNNPGCDGTLGNPCVHEDDFSAADAVVNDTVWITALAQKYPGTQETAIRSGISPDPGPLTELIDEFRLYKAPARAPVLSLRGDLGSLPGDTIKFYQISLKPRGGIFTAPLRLSNIGLVGFFLDSVVLDAGVNDGFLVTTSNAVPGTFVAVGGNYDFNLSFNTNGVGAADVGVRSGNLNAYIRSVAPAGNKTLPINLTVYVVPTLCFNRKSQIHSASNYTDVGNQGSIKDQGGAGMHYDVNEHDNFYDGGVWVAWDDAVPDGRGNCADGFPRKVTRQLFGDKFLRCISDGYLDSVSGGGYYNLSLTSVGAELQDSSIAWKNIWEQSTHADSSDFLIQTTKVINVGTNAIDSVALGVIYDLDVDVVGGPSASENVGGDTILSHAGRTWWFGWIAGNDVLVDTCSPGNFAYGFVVVPNSDNPGALPSFVRPRAGIVYQQAGFSYNIGCENPNGGDSLFERYAWNADVIISTQDRAYDSLHGTYQDTSAACIANSTCTICGGPGAYSSGPPYRADMGYMTVAEKVYNFPVNGGGAGLVARYGLDGLGALASGEDPVFSGPGETYTIIHVATSGGGLTDLYSNAIKGIDWYLNHANVPVGPTQTRLKGDLIISGSLTPADVVAELNYVFNQVDVAGGQIVPICVADLNNVGGLSPADVVLLLNGTFVEGGNGPSCPNCLRPCI
ncbi:MAG TPA: hypothetical protein VNL73_09310 [Verrucomicrobiae bacterium]|nr:hypothetical protein [Verrucomicrobiae bacterium]